MSRNWTPQQKNAIYATDGSVLVSAAAGSGKTAVLAIHRLNRHCACAHLALVPPNDREIAGYKMPR